MVQYADDAMLSFNASSYNNLKDLAIEKTNGCVKYFKSLDLGKML